LHYAKKDIDPFNMLMLVDAKNRPSGIFFSPKYRNQILDSRHQRQLSTISLVFEASFTVFHNNAPVEDDQLAAAFCDEQPVHFIIFSQDAVPQDNHK
jgi:hypothetical protein